MLERGPLPEVAAVHALIGRPPSPAPFLHHHPQLLRPHGILDNPFGQLGVGAVLEDHPLPRADLIQRPGRAAGAGSIPVTSYSSLSDSARWAKMLLAFRTKITWRD